jgi:glycosyltransferase involved in cell wall biosynthesis
MPTHAHARFIRRAIASLERQTFTDWELVVIDDASPDDTPRVVAPLLRDPRIRYRRLERNVGLGAALNVALDAARGTLLAYLTSDDVYHAAHLASLVAALEAHREAVLAYAGVRHHYNRVAAGVIEGHALQLVQVMHRRTTQRWTEREELVSDDLDRLFWERMRAEGAFVPTGQATCEWVDHPDQLHKLLREPEGGINPFRQRFAIAHPLRFHTSVGNRIDEVAQYRRYRERAPTPRAPDGLRILLIGELAYNADRVLALEEAGHRLFGLWMRRPYWYNTVGPLPFGHVEDVSFADWRRAVRRLRPDVIYALLNWQTVPFAHEVLEENTGIPFVWHFKEGPFICLEKGTWGPLIDLYRRADGRIYSSPDMRAWFEDLAPELRGTPSLLLDGDLPKRDWFVHRRSPPLSDGDGEIHTVVPGRPIGLHPHDVAELARERVHLHFYGDFTHGQWRGWIDKARARAGRFLHLHAQVDQPRWVEEFSRYDAGWLHFFASDNAGEIGRANWDDRNYPARLATLAAAGLPVLSRDNTGHVVATQSLARALDIGVFFRTMAEAAERMRDAPRMAELRTSMWRERDRFTFDHHVPRFVAFLREVIASRHARRTRVAVA